MSLSSRLINVTVSSSTVQSSQDKEEGSVNWTEVRASGLEEGREGEGGVTERRGTGPGSCMKFSVCQ